MRLIDEDGKQVGVLSKQEALQLARREGLDLVQVAPNAKPPVVKIIDFAKFKYQERRKHLEGKKKSKTQVLKEIRFTPFIAENDFNIRIKRAREFLEAGDKVNIVVKFVGRQLTRKDFGDKIITKAYSELQDISTMEREPSLRGKLLITTLAPTKKKSKK
jgi:translation initiation factor IF-3